MEDMIPPLSDLFFHSSSPTFLFYSLPLFPLRCVTLDYWKGKTPKSALLMAFAVLSLFALCHVIHSHKMESGAGLIHSN